MKLCIRVFTHKCLLFRNILLYSVYDDSDEKLNKFYYPATKLRCLDLASSGLSLCNIRRSAGGNIHMKLKESSRRYRSVTLSAFTFWSRSTCSCFKSLMTEDLKVGLPCTSKKMLGVYIILMYTVWVDESINVKLMQASCASVAPRTSLHLHMYAMSLQC